MAAKNFTFRKFSQRGKVKLSKSKSMWSLTMAYSVPGYVTFMCAKTSPLRNGVTNKGCP